MDTITHLTDRKNVIQEDINKAYEKNKISEETTAKALVSQMDNGETDGT